MKTIASIVIIVAMASSWQDGIEIREILGIITGWAIASGLPKEIVALKIWKMINNPVLRKKPYFPK